MKSLTAELLEELRQYGTCTISNAIEKFNVRTRNEGFTNGGLHCVLTHKPAVIGFAVTGRVRSAEVPVANTPGATFLDRTDWWDHVVSIPTPRIVVLQDMDHHPGRGAFWGEVHANIHHRLDCVAAVTNGAVRDLDKIERSEFQVLAGDVSVSHSYVHFVDYGEPVHIFGLKVDSGDLLMADRHGLLSIPIEIAAELPPVAEEIEQQKRHIIDYCNSTQFTIDGLKQLVTESAAHLHKIE